MQQDGTNLHIVMIDEKEVERLMLKTLEAINKYLVNVSNQHNTNYIDSQRRELTEEQLLRKQAYKETKDEIESSTAELERQKTKSLVIIVITIICFFISLIIFSSILFSEHLLVVISVISIVIITINIRRAL